MAEALTSETIWALLGEIKDPEIPVVSLVEMGIIRQVELDDEAVRVSMTPTFSGCPALKVMQAAVEERLLQAGAKRVEVTFSNRPAWSSDWISPEAREKLKSFGLAPPPQHGGNFQLDLLDVVTCPFCDSKNTVLKNSFGSTLCRAIFYCNSCQQPFEQFKPI